MTLTERLLLVPSIVEPVAHSVLQFFGQLQLSALGQCGVHRITEVLLIAIGVADYVANLDGRQ